MQVQTVLDRTKCFEWRSRPDSEIDCEDDDDVLDELANILDSVSVTDKHEHRRHSVAGTGKNFTMWTGFWSV